MAVLFTGGDLPSFNSYHATVSTTAGKFTAPATSAMSLATDGVLTTPMLNVGSSLWLHFECVVSSVARNDAVIIRAGSGVALATFCSTGIVKFADDSEHAAPFLTVDGTYRVDINYVTNGTLALCVDDQLLATYQIPFTTEAKMVEFRSAGAQTHYSQIIVANESTVSWKLAEMTATGEGTHNTWTGSYTDVTEHPMDLTTYISSNTPSQAETWAHSVLPDYNIVAVTVVAQARKSQNSPSMSALAHIGNADYTATFATIPLETFGPTVAVFANNPATGLSWSSAAVNATQFGIKSIRPDGTDSGALLPDGTVTPTPTGESADFSLASNSGYAALFPFEVIVTVPTGESADFTSAANSGYAVLI